MRALLERTVAAEQLVLQVAVTRLDVDEVEARVRRRGWRRSRSRRRCGRARRRPGRGRCGARRGAARLVPGRGVDGPTPGVRRAGAPRPGRRASSRRSSCRSSAVDGPRQSWRGFARAIRTDRERLAAPHQSRSARAEPAPPPAHEVSRAPVVGAVPTLHRKDREAVRRAAAGDLDRVGEGRRSSGGSANGSVDRGAPRVEL